MTTEFRSALTVVLASLVITCSVGCPNSNPQGPTPPPPTASITCNGKATTCEVVRDGTATIAWTSANVTGICRVTRNGVDTGWAGNSGSQASGALTDTVTFNVVCPGVSATVVVNIVPPVRLRVVSGLSGVAVAGASVVSDGAETVSSAGDGWATVNLPASATFNVALDAGGHWGPYESKYSLGRTDFLLWPITGANSGDLIRQMVFGDSSGYNNPGLTTMIRLDGPVSFYFDADLASNPTVMARFQTAAPILQAVIGFGVTVGSTTPIANTAAFRIYLDPSLNSQAATSVNVNRGRISGGYVVFRTLDNFSDYVIRHELAHVFGLWHHMGEGLVGKTFKPSFLQYSVPEQDNMRMMLRVAPGTRAPYNDRTAFGANALGLNGTVVIGCNVRE